MNRRRWLAAATIGALVTSRRAIGRSTPDDPGPEADGDEPIEPVERIRRRASEAGLPALRVREGERYLALGSARDDFIRGALTICESLADDYLSHFADRGFEVEAPAERMAMVALANRGEFAAFLGVEQAIEVTGVYEVGPNYLVLYDGRSGGPAGPRAERANTITLVHEAMHQLTFNSGLLDPASDIPLAISEGLATYGEVRRPDGRTRIGAVNAGRLEVIATELRRGGALRPLEELIGEDDAFGREESVQLAYAQSWLFVFGLMRNERSTGRFRDYLAALAGAEAGRPRVDLAREHLGDLARLDESLREFAARLTRGR